MRKTDGNLLRRATQCPLGWYVRPRPMMMKQIIGRDSTQKSLDIYVVVPRRKPAIEQVINVYINRIRITNVEVITDGVIVCGEFDVKILYAACMPSQPVHAVGIRCVRFSTGIDIPGARCGMDANAGVRLEYADCDCYRYGRDYWYKYKDYHNHSYYGFWNKNRGKKGCGYHHKEKCTRRCNLSVGLEVTASVFADREIFVHGHGGLPPVKPKG